MSNPKCDYDVFISYEEDIQESAGKCYAILQASGYKVWRDTNLANKNAIRQIAESILNAQIFLCLMTKKYCDSVESNREIEYAFKCRKTTVYLMIDNIHVQEMGPIGFMMGNDVVIECFKNMYSWWDDDLASIKMAIDTHLKVNTYYISL